MEFIYNYENNTREYVKYSFNIKSNGDVYYTYYINRHNKKICSVLEECKPKVKLLCKLTDKTMQNLIITAKQIKQTPYLVNNGRAFDAGSGNFYFIREKNGEKILLHSDGDHQLQSTDQKVIYIVNLIKRIIRVVMSLK